ncbi:unnamed protein product [Timema podura]|uniref:Uncharacterized protein n=1 Tax=Timema podura TaxID=61482 RepID=A0ABN7NLZ8_TIMPD|nr:unnamed protein product [Timema podura]
MHPSRGQCTWSNVTGRMVTLADTTLLQMTEVERRVMQKVALAKLQALNLGVTVRIPSDAVGNSTAHKPKRRAYLLKRKALTTGFFDTARGKDGDKDKGIGDNGPSNIWPNITGWMGDEGCELTRIGGYMD